MIVLDTHVLIWAVQDDEKLGVEAALTIEAAAMESSILVPAIAAWEIALIERRDRVVFPGGALTWCHRVLARPSFELVPLTPDVAIRTVQLDWDHRDPADRMIVATAIVRNAPLLTVDRKILDFAQQGGFEVIDARR